MKLTAKSKSLFSAVALVALLASLATGCSHKAAVDTVKLEYSFQSADSTNQAEVTQAIEAIEKADLTTALTKLQKVATDPKLTAEQKASVNDVVQQLQKH